MAGSLIDMLLILAAAPLETSLLRKRMIHPQTLFCGTTQVFSGRLQGQNIILAHGGIGQVNMTMQLTRLLSEHSPTAILLCGCGGSYPKSLLRVGDIALAKSETFGDLGVATANHFTPLDQLHLPQTPQLSPNIEQSIQLNADLLKWALEILPDTRCGPFVTVSCCSGCPELSTALEQRTGGICENMEGAAAAQVSASFNIPLLELRGISNPTGTRDPQQWDIARGTEAAQEAILALLENWPSE